MIMVGNVLDSWIIMQLLDLDSDREDCKWGSAER